MTRERQKGKRGQHQCQDTSVYVMLDWSEARTFTISATALQDGIHRTKDNIQEDGAFQCATRRQNNYGKNQSPPKFLSKITNTVNKLPNRPPNSRTLKQIPNNTPTNKMTGWTGFRHYLQMLCKKELFIHNEISLGGLDLGYSFPNKRNWLLLSDRLTNVSSD